MQEYLAELSGTLARKQQRKNTVLSHINKQAQLDKRAATYGFAVRPHNPADVSDPKAVRHFLNEVRSEVGHKISRINNPLLCSMDRDGELAVRQYNDEIHRLLISRNRWLVRCADIGVELSGEEQAIVDKDRSGVRLQKTYFGCAKELPEAQRFAHQPPKRLREEDESSRQVAVDDDVEEIVPEDTPVVLAVAEEHSAPSEGIVAAYLESIRTAHARCHAQSLCEEEQEFRRAEAACSRLPCVPTSSTIADFGGYILDYCPDGGMPQIVPDDEVKQRLLQRRKEAMRSQLSSLSRLL